MSELHDLAADQILESDSVQGALLIGRIMPKCMNLLIAKLDEKESVLLSLQPDCPAYSQAERDWRAARASLLGYSDALSAYAEMINETGVNQRLQKDTKQWVN